MSAHPTYLVSIDSITFTCKSTESKPSVTVCTGRREGGRRKVVLNA